MCYSRVTGKGRVDKPPTLPATTRETNQTMTTATAGVTTFYICPCCGQFWSKQPIPTNPALRHNGGTYRCSDCRRAQTQYDNERADAYYDN